MRSASCCSAAVRTPTFKTMPLAAHGISQPSRGHTPLGRILINKGASLEVTTTFGETPLHDAAGYGQAGFCKMLLRRGANVLAEDTKSKTALSYATSRGYPACVTLLKSFEEKAKAQQQAEAAALAAAEDFSDADRRRPSLRAAFQDVAAVTGGETARAAAPGVAPDQPQPLLSPGKSPRAVVRPPSSPSTGGGTMSVSSPKASPKPCSPASKASPRGSVTPGAKGSPRSPRKSPRSATGASSPRPASPQVIE